MQNVISKRCIWYKLSESLHKIISSKWNSVWHKVFNMNQLFLVVLCALAISQVSLAHGGGGGGGGYLILSWIKTLFNQIFCSAGMGGGMGFNAGMGANAGVGGGAGGKFCDSFIILNYEFTTVKKLLIKFFEFRRIRSWRRCRRTSRCEILLKPNKIII